MCVCVRERHFLRARKLRLCWLFFARLSDRAWKFPQSNDDTRATQAGAKQVVEETIAHPDCNERLDILINNAGVNAPEGAAAETSLETFRWVNRINVEGPFMLTQEALPHIIKSDAGRIVFSSSIIGHLAGPGNYPYCASKGAVLQLMRTLAVELAETTVTVNCISPGIMDTDMNSKFVDSEAASAKILGSVPMKRFGKPEDLQGIALLLCSPASAYITGQSFLIDGGYSCQ